MVDLVLCRHQPEQQQTFLFQAPNLSGIHPGDEVMCDTRYGQARASVVDVLQNVDLDSEIGSFVLNATGASRPLRDILGRMEFHAFNNTGEAEGVPIQLGDMDVLLGADLASDEALN